MSQQPDSEENASCKDRSRRWFLKSLFGMGGLTIAGIGLDEILPRTLCRPGEWRGPVTDHFNGTEFFNREPHRHYNTGNLLTWVAQRREKGEYPLIEKNAFRPDLAPEVSGPHWEVTMVNHSTLLIRINGCNILTDPIWSDYTSPVPFLGPKRFRPVGIAWEELPRIDVCLISHDHYDHFDVPTLKRLTARDAPLYIVPLGLKSLLEYHCGSVRCAELDWWQSHVSRGIRFCLTPAHHWSNRYRGTTTRCRSLWGGFRMDAPGTPSVYYVGDSASTSWFGEIYNRLGAPDVAIIPIGAYLPDWIRQHHMGPAEAVRCFQDLRAGQAIACHFGTWQLANEGYRQTLDDLTAALADNHISPERFIAPDNGQTLRGMI